MSNQGLMDIGQQWAEAERRGDVQALQLLLNDPFIGIGPLGFVLNRPQWLERYRSGDLRNDRFDFQEVSIREISASTAILVGIQVQVASYQGRDANGRFRASLVCLRQGESWLIAQIQLSGPLPEATSRGLV